jgi:hypothetical protein
MFVWAKTFHALDRAATGFHYYCVLLLFSWETDFVTAATVQPVMSREKFHVGLPGQDTV